MVPWCCFELSEWKVPTLKLNFCVLVYYKFTAPVVLDGYATWFNMNRHRVCSGHSSQTNLLLTDISWLQMLVINDYTHVLPGYTYHRHKDDHLIHWCPVKLLCWLYLILHIAGYSLMPVLQCLIVHMWKATFECCFWPFTDARILDTPLQKFKTCFL